MPAMLWSPTARINCRRAARSSRGNLLLPPCLRARALPPAPTLLSLLLPGDPRDESLAAVYSAARCNHAPDGRRDSGGTGGLPPVASFRASAGGLPHHSGADVLSRRQPGCDGLLGYRAARTQLRANPRLVADDLDEFLWKLSHHPAIQSGFEY